MIYVLYNESSGAHYGREKVEEKIKTFFSDESIVTTDTTVVDNKQEYIDKISKDDKLVIVGGDGTLNRFVNGIEDRDYAFDIYCYAAGTGNDFINDVNGVKTDELVHFNEYMRELPEIEVNGKTYKFLNGIGYGIDGYCCEEGDKYRAKTGKAPNYTTIALKGLLGKFKTVNARVTVDGVTREYKNVWMVPSMNGRYFGGGMMITPSQDRLNERKELSFVVVTAKSRLRLLTVFPKIFKGGHVKYTKLFKLFQGKELEVEFDRPVALQIDGETVLGVTSYKARSYSLKKEEATV
jgi:diacylglycerol kinase family enzyme